MPTCSEDAGESWVSAYPPRRVIARGLRSAYVANPQPQARGRRGGRDASPPADLIAHIIRCASGVGDGASCALRFFTSDSAWSATQPATAAKTDDGEED